MTDAAVEFPTSFGFTEEEVEKLAKRDALPLDNWYRWRVMDLRKSISQSGDNPGSYMFTLECRALADPRKPEGGVFGPPVRDNIIVPKDNPDVPGHVAPNTVGLVIQRLHALFPEDQPVMPRWEKNKLMWAGEEINPEDEEEKARETVRIMNRILDRLAEDSSLAVDCAFYGYFHETKSKKDDRTFLNISRHCTEMRPDRKSGKVPHVMTVGDTDFSPKAAPKKANATATTSKKTKKKVAKKKTSKR